MSIGVGIAVEDGKNLLPAVEDQIVQAIFHAESVAE